MGIGGDAESDVEGAWWIGAMQSFVEGADCPWTVGGLFARLQ